MTRLGFVSLLAVACAAPTGLFVEQSWSGSFHIGIAVDSAQTQLACITDADTGATLKCTREARKLETALASGTNLLDAVALFEFTPPAGTTHITGYVERHGQRVPAIGSVELRYTLPGPVQPLLIPMSEPRDE